MSFKTTAESVVVVPLVNDIGGRIGILGAYVRPIIERRVDRTFWRFDFTKMNADVLKFIDGLEMTFTAISRKRWMKHWQKLIFCIVVKNT